MSLFWRLFKKLFGWSYYETIPLNGKLVTFDLYFIVKKDLVIQSHVYKQGYQVYIEGKLRDGSIFRGYVDRFPNAEIDGEDYFTVVFLSKFFFKDMIPSFLSTYPMEFLVEFYFNRIHKFDLFDAEKINTFERDIVGYRFFKKKVWHPVNPMPDKLLDFEDVRRALEESRP